MHWFVLFLFAQCIMSGASEEASDAMEGSLPEAAHTKETCEQNKNQLESLKEIMMRNQQSLKKKEEEVQVIKLMYFRNLTFQNINLQKI